MTTTATANTNSLQTVIETVAHWDTPALERLAKKINGMVAMRKTEPELPEREAELIHKIKYGLPAKVLKRSKQLSEKMEWESITDEEHQELTHLCQQIEEFAVVRLENMIELARLRGLTVQEIMKQLNIKPR